MIDQTLLEYLTEQGVGLAAAIADGAPDPAPVSETADVAPIVIEAPDAPLAAMTSGVDRQVGSSDNDTLKGSGRSDNLNGLGGADRLIGLGGADTLLGGDGNDRLQGGGGADRLIGGGGADLILGNGGADLLKGNGGDDTLKGGGGSDRLIGGGGRDLLEGGGGKDFVKGGGGDDTLSGGPGLDTLAGGGGADVFLFSDRDIQRSSRTEINGFKSGTDIVDLTGVNGVGSFDDLDLSDTTGGSLITVNGSEIFFKGRSADDLSEFDFLISGGGSSDPFTGGNGDDALTSGPGNDLIRGRGGDDKLGAGAGLDTLIGGAGADIFVVRLVNGAIDPQIDIVNDFSYAEGDRVGLTEVLSGVSFSDLSDVVRATPSGTDTLIEVKRTDAFEDALILKDVTFETDDLIAYGFTAPPTNSTLFVENPYGFANNSLATADPIATEDGVYVAWVDQQNLDGNPFDIRPEDNENSATRDVFILNTTSGVLQRVSQKTSNDDRFIEAVSPALSADGRIVAYVQEEFSNSSGNVFIRDMAFPDSAPILVNVDENGVAGAAGTALINQNRGGLAGSRSNESISVVDISGDGTKVVFSTRTSLSAADTNSNNDIYVRDLSNEETTLISSIDGAAAGSGSTVQISEDGRYVAFTSFADFSDDENDTAAPTNDLFLQDTLTGETILISGAGEGSIGVFDMNADGSRIVLASSQAIDADDTNDLTDIYVVDIDLGSFSVTSRQRVSEAEGRFQVVDGPSFAPTISHDGDRIAFRSDARDLAPFGPEVSDGQEKLFLLDLETRELTTPDIPAAVANRESLIAHASLTDDGFVYRQETDAADGGNRSISDSIAIGTSSPLDVTEVSDTGVSRVERFSAIRSEIDTPGDVDTFLLSGLNDRRDLSFSVEGAGAAGGDLADAKLTISRKSGGELVPVDRLAFNASDPDPVNAPAIDDNSGLGNDAFLRVDSGSFQDLFIQVEGVNGATGSYRLVIDDLREPPSGSALPAPDAFLF